MKKKLLQRGIIFAVIIAMILPTSALAKPLVQEKNQLEKQTTPRVLEETLINLTIIVGDFVIKIEITINSQAAANVTNIYIGGVSNALLGRAFGENTVNTTIPSMAPGETVLINVPTQKGLAIMQYNVNAQYQYNGTIENTQYGPDKYLLFFVFPIDIKG